MRKFMVVVCFVVLFAMTAMAADYPKAEFYGGYQFTRLEGGINANGFNFAFNGNLNDSVGITADFAASYKSENGVSFSNYTYTFGPTLALRAHKAYTPFVHALIGGDHASAAVTGFGSGSGNGFAFMAGGGVDANLSHSFGYRVAQVDWLMIHGSGGTSSKNVRITTGLVIRF